MLLSIAIRYRMIIVMKNMVALVPFIEMYVLHNIQAVSLIILYVNMPFSILHHTHNFGKRV